MSRYRTAIYWCIGFQVFTFKSETEHDDQQSVLIDTTLPQLE